MRSHVVREVRGLRAGVPADGADERPDAGVDAQVRRERVGLRERAAAQVAAEAARPGVDQLVPTQVADRREALAAGGAAAVARRAAAAEQVRVAGVDAQRRGAAEPSAAVGARQLLGPRHRRRVRDRASGRPAIAPTRQFERVGDDVPQQVRAQQLRAVVDAGRALRTLVAADVAGVSTEHVRVGPPLAAEAPAAATADERARREVPTAAVSAQAERRRKRGGGGGGVVLAEVADVRHRGGAVTERAPVPVQTDVARRQVPAVGARELSERRRRRPPPAPVRMRRRPVPPLRRRRRRRGIAAERRLALAGGPVPADRTRVQRSGTGIGVAAALRRRLTRRLPSVAHQVHAQVAAAVERPPTDRTGVRPDAQMHHDVLVELAAPEEPLLAERTRVPPVVRVPTQVRVQLVRLAELPPADIADEASLQRVVGIDLVDVQPVPTQPVLVHESPSARLTDVCPTLFRVDLPLVIAQLSTSQQSFLAKSTLVRPQSFVILQMNGHQMVAK